MGEYPTVFRTDRYKLEIPTQNVNLQALLNGCPVVACALCEIWTCMRDDDNRCTEIQFDKDNPLLRNLNSRTLPGVHINTCPILQNLVKGDAKKAKIEFERFRNNLRIPPVGTPNFDSFRLLDKSVLRSGMRPDNHESIKGRQYHTGNDDFVPVRISVPLTQNELNGFDRGKNISPVVPEKRTIFSRWTAFVRKISPLKVANR